MTTARYDPIAGVYAARPDTYTGSATAALLDLVGPVADRRVLDMACGHGTISRELARRGGTVVGVDLSAGLLEEARAREASEPLGITHLNLDVTSDHLFAGAEVFDLVTCHFGLSDIDDLSGVLANVASLLRPGGAFVFSILHPCFPGVEQASGSWPTGRSYYDEGWWRPEGELSWIRRAVGANHRMLSTYLNALAEVDLAVDRVCEPRPDKGWAAGSPGADALPLYLAARVRLRTACPPGSTTR